MFLLYRGGDKMKKTIFAFLFLFSFLFLFHEHAKAAYSLDGVVTASQLNVRDKPTATGSIIIGKLDYNTKVIILSHKNNWGTIEYNGKTGYVSMDYIRLLNDAIENGNYIIKLNSRHNLYSSTTLDTKIADSLSPQLLKSSNHYGQWFEINTWIGKKWINLFDGTNEVISYVNESGVLRTNTRTFIHSEPFSEYKTPATLAAQTVYVTAKDGNWYKVKTWLGEKWLNIPTTESTYIPVTDVNMSLTVENREYLHEQPFEDTVSTASISPQTVQVVGKNGNWYKIKTWLGNRWINYVPLTTYKVITSTGNETTYYDATEATNAYNNTTGERYLTQNGKVINMTSGYALTTTLSNIYDSSTNKAFTYVSSNTQLDVTNITDNNIYIHFDGIDGYISKTNATLVPFYNGNRSYFKRVGDDLSYHINGSSFGVKFSKAPPFMTEGTKYYTFDNFKIDNKEVYQYFNYLSVRSDSTYTAIELDSYLQSVVPTSPLIGKTQLFIDAATKHNLNGLYLLAHAIHESDYGRSSIARDKNNFFGITAYDSDAYDSATGFATPEIGIDEGAKWISDNYGDPSDWRYINGSVLGNKRIGMNVKYASDPFWGIKIAGHMYRADQFLGKKEYKKYNIGYLPQGTTIYDVTDTSKTVLFTLPEGRYVSINQTITNAQGTFLEVVADEGTRQFIYVTPDKLVNLPVY